MIPTSDTRTNRVRLCAIAKDEGAYLADWIFHHLRFGFDTIDLRINGTSDSSLAILERIAAAYPQVRFEVADQLLEQCLSEQRYFQHAAYAEQARLAREDGCTHAAFLDLDEYWLPADLALSIHDFLPSDPDVAVVSFPWCTDVPDPSHEPFRHPLMNLLSTGRAGSVQLDAHVKSVVRLDDRLIELRTHSARITQGRRLWVREEFPMSADSDQQEGQQWGSIVPTPYLLAHRDQLPEAFVLHAINRSQVEYVACLAKGLRQTGKPIEFKNNRFGYVASGAPMLRVGLSQTWWQEYDDARAAFVEETGVATLIREAERQTQHLFERAITDLSSEPERIREHASALRGLSLPALDAALPGWASAPRVCVDGAALEGGRLRVWGWAFTSATDQAGNVPLPVTLELHTLAGRALSTTTQDWSERPDVAAAYPGAPLRSGFVVTFDVTNVGRPRAATFVGRVGEASSPPISLRAQIPRKPGVVGTE